MLNGIRKLFLEGIQSRTANGSSPELPSEVVERISRIRSRNLTYLSESKLGRLSHTCRSIEALEIPGMFLEAGCALGGSAILIASLKTATRPLCVYDVFGMIPPPTKDDTPDVHARYRTIAEGQSKGLGGNRYYGYIEDLFAVVQGNFGTFGIDCNQQSVTFIKGLVQDTMIIDKPVAFAHVDVDWYDPVMTCLTRIFPNLVPGGSIILDDYHDWGGCRKATDEFLRGVAGQFDVDDSGGSLKITKR